MKNDFAPMLSGFLGNYLPDIRAVSPHTIASYSDAFRLFLEYCRDERGLKIERMSISDVSAVIVNGFLEWLEKGRGCTVSTRNQRLAALSSFFRYVQVYSPASVGEIQKILSIPYKKNVVLEISYISFDDMKLILSLPDCRTEKGRRDRMLLVLYDTGARVSELTGLKVRDIRLDPPPKVILHGKGMKQRSVPLMDETKSLFQDYLNESGLTDRASQMKPVFRSWKGEEFTRAGVSYIIHKYTTEARKQSSTIPVKVTPHIFRHSKAMHLLQAGINIIYIKDILGHSDVTTTQQYLRADMAMKEEALKKVKIDIHPQAEAHSWTEDKDLLDWLTELGKKTGRIYVKKNS